MIRSGNFRVSVPERYEIVEHDHYQEARAFFENLPPFDDPRIGEFLKKPGPDWKTIRKMRNSFEVKMGRYSLIIRIQDHGEPEDLADMISASTRHAVTLADFAIGNYRGKTYGRYSNRFTWIDWWVKEGDCMICFNLQGRRTPSPAIREDVETILSSTEWVAETSGATGADTRSDGHDDR